MIEPNLSKIRADVTREVYGYAICTPQTRPKMLTSRVLW